MVGGGIVPGAHLAPTCHYHSCFFSSLSCRGMLEASHTTVFPSLPALALLSPGRDKVILMEPSSHVSGLFRDLLKNYTGKPCKLPMGAKADSRNTTNQDSPVGKEEEEVRVEIKLSWPPSVPLL